jgi:hypothetical protein
LAFLALLVLYIVTLAPSVTGGDSGELTAAALTGGVPHPPGYPLFALLARFFAALPLGHSLAWRVNLLSAVSTAAAGGLVCAVVLSWTSDAMAGLLAAALFGTNPIVWLHATGAEVFGLNALFVAWALYLWLEVERSYSRRRVFALLFVSGLALCNHQTFVFVGAPLVLRSLWVARRKLGVLGLAQAIGLGLLGMAPYFYLMSASASSAAVAWGDQTTLGGLVAHVLRRDYGTFRMGQTNAESPFVAEGTFVPTLWLLWGRSFSRLLWLGPLLAVTGLVLGIRNRKTRMTTAVLLFVLGSYSLTFCALSNLTTSKAHLVGVLTRFCIQSDLLLAIAAGLGFAFLLNMLGVRGTWLRLIPLGVAAVFLLGVAVHAGLANRRNDTVYQDFVTTAFASLPPDSVVISTMGDDVTGSVLYFHEVEKLRPDVIALDGDYLRKDWYTARLRRIQPELHLPQGSYGKYGWNIKQLLDRNPGRPLLLIGHLDAWDESWKAGYKMIAYGLVHSLIRDNELPGYEEWVERDRQAMGTYDITTALRAPEESWEMALGQRVLDEQVGRAHLAIVYGHERGEALGQARTALRLLEDVIAKSGGDEELGILAGPGMRKLETGSGLWQNLGLVYQILSRTDETYVSRFGVACKRFVERASPDNPDLPAARQYLEQAGVH